MLTLSFGFGSLADKSVPTLYRNDTKYTISEYPPEMINGDVYVPLSFFVGLSDIQYVYSSSNPGFYLRNENTGRFISFAFNTSGIVVDSEFVSIVFPILNNTVYMPLEYCADILSLKIENTNGQRIRLSDGSQKLSFEELIKIYEESDTPDDPTVILPDDPHNPSDAPAKIRQLYITIDARLNDSTEGILSCFKKYNKKGTFLFDANSIKNSPETVLRIFVEGHAIGIAYVSEEDLNEAQRALYSILNTNTRIVGFLNDAPSFETLTDLEKRGYVTFEGKALENSDKSVTDIAKEIYNYTFKKNKSLRTFTSSETDRKIIDKILNYTSDDNGIDVSGIDTTAKEILGGN